MENTYRHTDYNTTIYLILLQYDSPDVHYSEKIKMTYLLMYHCFLPHIVLFFLVIN